VRVAGAWTYLYRGVDSNGDTLDFLLRATRDRKAAIAFFRKTLGAAHTTPPRVVTVDKNPAYPIAFKAVQRFCQVDEAGAFSPWETERPRSVSRRTSPDPRCRRRALSGNGSARRGADVGPLERDSARVRAPRETVARARRT
jgi:transposase-like protein